MAYRVVLGPEALPLHVPSSIAPIDLIPLADPAANAARMQRVRQAQENTQKELQKAREDWAEQEQRLFDVNWQIGHLKSELLMVRYYSRDTYFPSGTIDDYRDRLRKQIRDLEKTRADIEAAMLVLPYPTQFRNNWVGFPEYFEGARAYSEPRYGKKDQPDRTWSRPSADAQAQGPWGLGRAPPLFADWSAR